MYEHNGLIISRFAKKKMKILNVANVDCVSTITHSLWPGVAFV